MNTNRLAGVKSRGARHTQSPLPISSKHVPSFRKQLVNPYSSRITVPRICSSRERFVMTRRKKKPQTPPKSPSVEGSLLQQEGRVTRRKEYPRFCHINTLLLADGSYS